MSTNSTLPPILTAERHLDFLKCPMFGHLKYQHEGTGIERERMNPVHLTKRMLSDWAPLALKQDSQIWDRISEAQAQLRDVARGRGFEVHDGQDPFQVFKACEKVLSAGMYLINSAWKAHNVRPFSPLHGGYRSRAATVVDSGVGTSLLIIEPHSTWTSTVEPPVDLSYHADCWAMREVMQDKQIDRIVIQPIVIGRLEEQGFSSPLVRRYVDPAGTYHWASSWTDPSTQKQRRAGTNWTKEQVPTEGLKEWVDGLLSNRWEPKFADPLKHILPEPWRLDYDPEKAERFLHQASWLQEHWSYNGLYLKGGPVAAPQNFRACTFPDICEYYSWCWEGKTGEYRRRDA